MVARNKPFPHPGWWKHLDLERDQAVFNACLRQFFETEYEPDEVEFTHDVYVDLLIVVHEASKTREELALMGAPQLCLTGIPPVRDNILVNSNFQIGQAGGVEVVVPITLKLAFISIGDQAPVYCQVSSGLSLRLKG